MFKKSLKFYFELRGLKLIRFTLYLINIIFLLISPFCFFDEINMVESVFADDNSDKNIEPIVNNEEDIWSLSEQEKEDLRIAWMIVVGIFKTVVGFLFLVGFINFSFYAMLMIAIYQADHPSERFDN